VRLFERESRLRAAAERAVNLWGAEKQLRQMSEECGELVAAINQHERGRITEDELASEIADVLITAAQARYIIGQKVDAHVLAKLERLEGLIAQGMNSRGGAR
jgi:NTP pyrophosphatase (non-canonical NTP hydrolase)